MGTFSIWHWLIVLLVLAVVPVVVLLAVRPTGPNRFGPAMPPRSFGDAVTVCLGKFVDFNGRASRSEYWWFYLASLLTSIAVTLVARPIVGELARLMPLVLLLPGLAAGARRLHDTNRSAWWLLLNLTGIGGFALLILFAQPSQGDDRVQVFE